MKEMLVAVQLERRYTKAEIFTLYANQINSARRVRRRSGVAACTSASPRRT